LIKSKLVTTDATRNKIKGIPDKAVVGRNHMTRHQKNVLMHNYLEISSIMGLSPLEDEKFEHAEDAGDDAFSRSE
jgi:hypothetical protein